MVFNIIDTPRTEIGDQTRMSGLNDLDMSTQHSIPSPSKNSNDLLSHIRGMRPAATRTPRTRAPFGDRHNLPSKAEFTPLLKSAARNNFRGLDTKENMRQLQTPSAHKRPYGGFDSPALPFNSSVIMEEYTASDQGEGHSIAPPISSSSPMSTPMAAREGEGPLDHRGNLATLREQEARLEQIDKENFSLKLKIHFMEEALRRNGKEFNEAAIKENTELKVDKVTLQRDLKQCRKLLAQSERDLADYRQQFQEYAQKLKGRHASEEMCEELERLRKAVSEKEAETKKLLDQLSETNDIDIQVQKLQDECADLEHELRDKDRELDEKDEALEKLRSERSNDAASLEELQEKEKLLEEKEDEIEALQQALRKAESEFQERLDEKETQIEEKDDEIATLSDQLKSTAGDESMIRSKDQDLQDKDVLRSKDEEIADLKRQLEEADGDKSLLRGKDRECQSHRDTIEDLQRRLRDAETSLEETEEQRRRLQKAKADLTRELETKEVCLEEKDGEARSLRQKLESASGRNDAAEKLQDKIDDLEAELRGKNDIIDKQEDEMDILDENLRKEKQQADADLQSYEEQIAGLEEDRKRYLVELQQLRDKSDKSSGDRHRAIEQAEEKIRVLEDRQRQDEERERQLQQEVNKLHDRIQRLENDGKRRESNMSDERHRWTSERGDLESSKQRAEELATSLQRTISQLKETEGNPSGLEVQLQRLWDSGEQQRTSENSFWSKKLSEVQRESERHLQSYQDTSAKLSEAREALSRVQDQLKSSQAVQAALKEQIEGLEDEIEVLQSGFDKDAAEVTTAREEVDSLRRQLRDVQQDLARAERGRSDVQTQMDDLKSARRDAASPRSQSAQEKKLRADIERLEDELRRVRNDSEDLRARLSEAEAARTDDSASRRIKDLQSQLLVAKKESTILTGNLSEANKQLDILQRDESDLRQERDKVQQQARELKLQISSLQREHDRKSQSQVLEYERDISNLEQDLEKMQTEKLAAEKQQIRLKSKVTSLESQLTAVRTRRTSGETSLNERTDLQMLRDAKLETEDLELQIKERDSRIKTASIKEMELRNHLKRLREERADQASRADRVANELESLQREHDHLLDEFASVHAQIRKQAQQRPASTPGAKADLVATQRKHAAELRGLVKQIEYLGARCRREERFRADLGYIKNYFTKQVEMHGAYTRADLKLVKAMGIPTDDVVEQEKAALEEKVGRRQTRSGSRPSLKCVGLMIVAAVRMRRAAEGWGKVKSSHESLVKKLRDVQQGRKRVSGKS